MMRFVDIIGSWMFPTRREVTRRLQEADERRRGLVRKMDVQLGRLARVNRLQREVAAVEGRMRGRS